MSEQLTQDQVSQIRDYKYVAADTVVAIVSSCIQIFIGYPLDCIKTRMQLHPNAHSNTFQYIVSILKNESLSSLYNGVSSPLTSAVFSYSIYYVAFEWARRQFCALNKQDVNHYIPLYQIFLSGAFGGTISDIIDIPLEMGKIQIQNQRMIDNTKAYQGPLSLLMKTVKEKGIRSVYKYYLGSSVTLIRDFIGCGTFFTVHQYTLMRYTPEGKTRHDVSQMGILVAGLLAGSCTWLFCYPADVVKTRMQGDNINNPKHTNSLGYVKEIYQQGGLKQFFKGLPITTLRSVIVNVVSMYAYENLHKASYSYLNDES